VFKLVGDNNTYWSDMTEKFRINTAFIFLFCFLFVFTSLRLYAQETEKVVYKFNSVNRMEPDKLLGKYKDKPWEIKAIFENDDGHIGTFSVGDRIRENPGDGFLRFSIGPVGLDGEGYFVQTKKLSNFLKVVAVMCLMDKGKVVEKVPLTIDYC
jgi:hypothetical protein